MKSPFVSVRRVFVSTSVFALVAAMLAGCYGHAQPTAALPPGTVRITAHPIGGGPRSAARDEDPHVARRH